MNTTNTTRPNMNPSLIHRKQRGFSIIEALIAGLVLSFGSLALVGAQVALSRNSDVAKQRTEATRLAQRRIEELRTYASATAQAGVPSFENLAGNTDTPEILNTQFQIVTTVGGLGSDLHRPVAVTVNWTDRGGVAQSVVLSSVIAKTNLWKVGLIMQYVGGNWGGGGYQQRDNNVPFPATDIGNGRSTYRWPGNSTWYVFNNSDADVLYRCQTEPTSTTNLDSACTQITGYVVAGYVGVTPRTTGNNRPTTIDAMLTPWVISTCSIAIPDNVGSQSCFVQDVVVSNAINPNCPYFTSRQCRRTSNGETFPADQTGQCPSGSTVVVPSRDEIERLNFFKCYAALVELNDSRQNQWGGRMTFAADPPGDAKLCRYPHNLVNPSGVYVDIAESLSNENYLAITSGDCTDGLFQHQPPLP